MREGEYTLQQQRGAKGYFGKVRLEIEMQQLPECSISFLTSCDSKWKLGVEFGLVYGYDLFQRSDVNMSGVAVRVLEVIGQPVDTTCLVMAFVSAHAIWKALEWIPVKCPVFDPKTGHFTFPK